MRDHPDDVLVAVIKILVPTLIAAALIVLSFTMCTTDAQLILKPDYQYWRVGNVDYDGQRDTLKIVYNQDYGARVLEDIIVTCESECVSVTEFDADNYLIKLCAQDNKGRVFPSGIGAGYVTEGCGTAFCEWIVPKADFLPPDLNGYWWFTVGQGQQQDTYFFNELSLSCNPLPIELALFEYERVGRDYLFHVITASEINVDSILIYGSNDAKIWRQVAGIKARNELSGSAYQIWYQR